MTRVYIWALQMRSTLLFSLTLFLIACSDNSTNTHSTESDLSEKNRTVKQPPVQTQPLKTPDKPVKTETESNASAEAEMPLNGHTIFVRKCASCHGVDAEKAALNRSQIIAGWDKKRIISALKGYQDGSYGSSLKGIMKGQASALSDEQIEAVAEYISTL